MLLRTENITKKYGSKTIIGDINITLGKGEIVSLLGVSGAGKTTLFNIIAGLINPDEGRIFLNDEDITGQSGRIGYMLQKDLLLPHKKIVDNVSLPLQLRGVKKADARAQASPLFADFGLDGYQDKYPCQLSGGMRQRAALLRTHLASSDIALLDEPFSALDTITKSAMHKWYLDVADRIGMSTLLITHDIDEAILLSDRIYILRPEPAGAADKSGAGRIAGEIKITQPRPRSGDFNLTEEFLSYKKQIIQML